MKINFFKRSRLIGQGIACFVILFLFGNSALAYTDNFANDLGSGDEIQLADIGTITWTDFADFNAQLGSCFNNSNARLNLIGLVQVNVPQNNPSAPYGNCNGTTMDYCFAFNGLNPRITKIDNPNGITMQVQCYSSSPDGLKYADIVHIDWLPQTTTDCTGSSATSALCRIGSAVVTGSTGILSDVIGITFSYIVVFSIIVWFLITFGGYQNKINKK